MKLILNTLYRLTAFIPRKFPTTGIPAFTAYANRLIEAYGFPNNDTFRATVATMILHFPNKKDGHPVDGCAPRTLARAIRRAMANECAFHVADAERLAQKERAEQEKKKAKEEAQNGSSSENASATGGVGGGVGSEQNVGEVQGSTGAGSGQPAQPSTPPAVE